MPHSSSSSSTKRSIRCRSLSTAAPLSGIHHIHIPIRSSKAYNNKQSMQFDAQQLCVKVKYILHGNRVDCRHSLPSQRAVTSTAKKHSRKHANGDALRQTSWLQQKTSPAISPRRVAAAAGRCVASRRERNVASQRAASRAAADALSSSNCERMLPCISHGEKVMLTCL
jgi:hypothetical protein